VIGDLPDGVSEVVVVDNASTDDTEANARAAGATVVREPRRGYGQACLAGLAYVAALPPDRRPDVVAFLDGDHSDHPEELADLLAPLARDEADFVVGSRLLGDRLGRVEPGALLPQARYGNAFACAVMRRLWGAPFTDLGPFRAIRYDALCTLGMRDRTFGWTVEMQVKALRAGLRCLEVPVSYRRRTGVSKITGTVSGTLRASAKILWTLGRYALTPPARSLPSPESSHTQEERRGSKRETGSASETAVPSPQ
jgi:glycosyltransferase involved in cell wall biosynthesis